MLSDLLGFTPLYAAIAGRRWDTAKLVLAIAAAQYHPENDEKKFTTDDIHLGEVLPICRPDHEADDI